MDILKSYVDEFNSQDEECYANDVKNADALEWMRREVPIFECPDKDIERAYYFRFWTYRKHIKTTEDGVVISEFLPSVPWAGRHNTINAAAGHHIYEGRWLRGADKYLRSYVDFLLTPGEKSHAYSTWLADAIYKYASVRGDFSFGEDFLERLDAYYSEWERTHGLSDGSFWSIDDRDAMEYSASGTSRDGVVMRGIRPTLNSYMCADALAIARLADRLGNCALREKYEEKHRALKSFINERLFDDGFYRAYHYARGEEPTEAVLRRGRSPRELIGYIPFMFEIPEGRDECFDLLLDPEVFFTEYGPTTLEKTDERFLFAAEHECLWNGYVWPFATSQALTGLYLAARRSKSPKLKRSFITLLSRYAGMHKRTREDGVVVSWIDEVIDPERGEWSSRRILRDLGWRPELGGYERGKDYNHSTFCDLVISGLAGASVEDGAASFSPLIPDEWEYLRLSGVRLLGKDYEIIYDKTGERYSIGAGLTVREL